MEEPPANYLWLPSTLLLLLLHFTFTLYLHLPATILAYLALL